MFCVNAVLEVVVVVLAVGMALPSFPILPRRGICLPFWVLRSCPWALFLDYVRGLAHLGVIRDVLASPVDSGARCVRATKYGYEMTSHACALRVRAYHVFSEQGLANYYLGPGDTRRIGLLGVSSFHRVY